MSQSARTGDTLQDPVLPFARYRLRFKAPEKAQLPAFSGSAWRGALGHALKKIVCVTHLKACSPCLLYRSCPYPYIFETPPPLSAQKMRKYPAVPHPFLLEVPFGPQSAASAQEPEKEVHSLGLTLIGHGYRFLPHLIYAFQRAGEQGLGKGRVPMQLTEVWQAEPAEGNSWVPIYESGKTLRPRPIGVPTIPALPPALRLRLGTPVRLERDGHLVTPERFRFSDLFGALLRRISMLTYFHTDTPLETDFAGLMEQARQVNAAEVRLQWKDWTRYSSRQKTKMQMGGLVGEVCLELPEGSPLWPYLWLGQWVHAGKGTSMGLGQYAVETASLPKSAICRG